MSLLVQRNYDIAARNHSNDITKKKNKVGKHLIKY